MKDTAYTSQALSSHTDTTYFTDPAGLQMFHLLSHTSGSGGESMLVDGFRAAELLKSQDILSYTILSQVPIPWHASGNKGITITPMKPFPVLQHEDFKEGHGPGQERKLLQVRWNNDDRATVPLATDFEHRRYSAVDWYNAARKWSDILRSGEYWEQLVPGRPISMYLHRPSRFFVFITSTSLCSSIKFLADEIPQQSSTTGAFCMDVGLSPGREGCVEVIVSVVFDSYFAC